MGYQLSIVKIKTEIERERKREREERAGTKVVHKNISQGCNKVRRH